jgi:hypothetical protein
MWRLVVKRIATLQEIETHYSFDDILRANAVLDMADEIERATIEGLKQ